MLLIPSFTATYSGFVNGDTEASLDNPPIFSTSCVQNSSVGNYPITVSGTTSDVNYVITYVTGTITVRTALLTVHAQSTSKVYGNDVPPLSYTVSGFVLDDTEADLLTPVIISTTATSMSPVGAYPIVAGYATAGNYTVKFTDATLKVTKALLVITADDKTRRIGQPNPLLTASYSGFANGDDDAALDTAVTLTTSATTSAPGIYSIKGRSAKDLNYTITFVNGKLTILR